MTDNTQFWQPFPTQQPLMNPNGVIPIQQIDPVNPWHKDDLTNFDMHTQNNRHFYTDGYNSSEYNEGDSPESSHARIDQMDVTPQDGTMKERRKEQNRAAQRAFRERKEKFVKELQLKIKHMELKHKEEVQLLKKENRELKDRIKNMEAEIYTLKGATMAFNVSIQKLQEVGLDLSCRLPPPRELTPPDTIRASTASNATTTTTTITTFNNNNNNNRKINSNSHVPSYSPSSHADNKSRDPQPSSKLGPSIISDRHKIQTRIYDPLLDSINVATTKSFLGHPVKESIDPAFAEREGEEKNPKAFSDSNDSNIVAGERMIPTADTWQILADHPNFEKFDIDELWKPLQQKSRFSDKGPTIPESELRKILHRMDTV